MAETLGPDLDLTFTLNGAEVRVDTTTATTLADVLRDALGLTGTKVACARAVCGACTVLIDGRPAASCATLAFEAQGRDVRTIEGLAADGELSDVQAAFADRSAFQCGYCTAGMIMTTQALLAHDPEPSRETINDWLGANICRCTGYTLIVEAVEAAAKARREKSP